VLTAVAVGVALVVVPAGTAAASRHDALPTTSRPRRLLVLSLPATTWADLAAVPTPNLSRLMNGAAVADLATRATGGPARLGDGYATLSAGSPSAVDGKTDGDALDVGEPFGREAAANEFRLRTGRTVRRGLVQLGLAGIVEKNAGLLYDARIGALGDALSGAGFRRSVIANADGTEPSTPLLPRYRRNAVTGLMRSEGTVPGGAVGPELLQADPTAPFGVRLSADAVEQAFQAAWLERSVVLVEASDLVRANDYKAFAAPDQWEHLRRRALAETDAMVGRLVTHVDFRRDAVVVYGPLHPAGESALTIAAVRAPGVEPGLLRSATTRRSGFSTLIDIAPTILDVLGIQRPSSMQGTPLVVESRGGSAAQRRTMLIEANSHAIFRDQLLSNATSIVIALVVAIGLGVLAFGGVATLRRWLRRASLALIWYLIATYVAALLHFDAHGGKIAFWLFVVAFVIAFVALCELAGRRSALDPLMLALAALVLLHVADSFAGARAEFNSVFGNSATVGIRFAGLGNLSFSQLAAASIILAGLLAWRLKAPRGLQVATAILAVSLVALAPPIWGQKFGAVLSATPACALLVWLLLGRSVRFRTIVALGGVLVLSGVLVGVIDLLRPGDQQTHVGRFFDTIGGGGSSSTLTVIHRKADEAIRTFGELHWFLVIAAVLAVTVYLCFARGAPLRVAAERVPTLVPTATALAVLAVLGLALNDSGIAVPGMMLSVAGAAIVYVGAVYLDEIDDSCMRSATTRPERAVRRPTTTIAAASSTASAVMPTSSPPAAYPRSRHKR